MEIAITRPVSAELSYKGISSGRQDQVARSQVRSQRRFVLLDFCDQVGKSSRRCIGTPQARPSLTFPQQAVKRFAEACRVSYGSEICGVAAGANSLRKPS